MTASLLVFLASSRSIACLLHRAFAVQSFCHLTLVIAVIGCVFRWWLVNQMLQQLNAQFDHVCSFGLWCRRLLTISLLVRGVQILHHGDDGFGIVYFVVQVLGFDLELCLRHLRSPCILCGVGDIGGDHETLHVVVESDAVCDGLCNCGGEFFMICCGPLSPIKVLRHNVHHHMPGRCCGWPFSSTCEGAKKMMELILINRSEVRSICCAKDWVGDLCADAQDE